MTPVTPNLNSLQISRTLLTAQADANGARAEVSRTDLRVTEGAEGQASRRRSYDINRIFKAETELQTARSERAEKREAVSEKRKSGFSDEAAVRFKKRLNNMMKALKRLGANDFKPDQLMITIYGRESSQSVAVFTTGHVRGLRAYGGDQAIAVNAKSATDIQTGGGNDALAIDADFVEGVNTDSGGEFRPVARFRGFTIYAQSQVTSGNDAVAIQAKRAADISTGGGYDAIAIQADMIRDVNAGDGADAISLLGGIVGGIQGGYGNDGISVDAAIGLSVMQQLQKDSDAAVEYLRPEAVADRLRLATNGYADVSGGEGDDAIAVNVQEILTVEGGSGNDVISVAGGTVGLRVGAQSGDDTVAVGYGAEVVVQVDQGEYSVSYDGQDMVVSHDGGSVRIKDYEQAGAIGVSGTAEAGDREDGEGDDDAEDGSSLSMVYVSDSAPVNLVA